MPLPSENEATPQLSPPLVYCVVVNWNGWQDTLACLSSLACQDYPRLRVIVVDNGSTNDSSAKIRESHPWIDLIETGKNLGFAGGCNVGTRRAVQNGADYIWLLNNDTIAPSDTASKMIRIAQVHPKAGAIGSVLYFMDDPQKVQAWGGGSLNLWTGYVSHFKSPAQFGPNCFLTGASLLIPRHICEEVGVLYEGCFMYCDDSDFCLRVQRAGYELVVATDTAILHKEGGSTTKRSAVIDGYSTTSAQRLLRRHAPVPAVSIIVFLTLRVLNRIRRGEWKNLAAVGRGAAVFFREFQVTFSDQL